MSRRIVMLAGPGQSTSIVYHALAAEYGVVKVILEDPVPRWKFLRRRARRYGWVRVFGQVLFIAMIVPYLRFEARGRILEIKKQNGLRDDPIGEALILRVPSANGPECRAALERLAPEVIVVNGTRILSKELLEAIPVPFLNIHAGITPTYRGVHGGYWALVYGDRELCGVTVHRVDPGIDTGEVLFQARIETARADNFATYPLLQLAAGIRGLIEGLGKGFSAVVRPGVTTSRLLSHPTAREYLAARLTRGVR